LSLSWGHVWWGFSPEMRRRKSLRLIGTIPTFGWYFHPWWSIGLQLSLGFWHGYVILQSRRH
jgi:hypothetical protein